VKESTRVLIAAPAGYVGRQLLARFGRESDVHVRVLVADARRIRQDLHPETEIVEGSLLEPAILLEAAQGIDVAYYPVRVAVLNHALEPQLRDFARKFRDACIAAGVKRIVYVGSPTASAQPTRLLSTARETMQVLGAYPERIQLVSLCPGLLIGPGSVSYELLAGLARIPPILFLPSWTRAEVRPLALRDMIEYLVHTASLSTKDPLVLEVGAGRVSVSDLLRLVMQITHRSRVAIRVPFAIPRLSAAVLTAATPFSYPMSLELVRSLDALRQGPPDAGSDRSRDYFPEISPLTCEQAIAEAVAETAADHVESRWTDSLADVSYRSSESAMHQARYQDVRRQDFGDLPRSRVFRSMLALGGKAGWFSFDLLWRIRGLLDKLLGGFGTSVGRRSSRDLRTGDMLDVWRVVDVVENERLLLEAQMNVFGAAWLEFRLEGNVLVQTAYYSPGGIVGVLYWYSMLPFHGFIFPDMVKGIVARARED
jgi:uncharacterized protein YbjT (DUF2867 family)